jgi:hypothetical protein
VKTVKTDKSGKSLNVLVDSKQSGWKFPDGFATQASGDGTKTYYAIPVEYTLLEPADASRTLADIVADYGDERGVETRPRRPCQVSLSREEGRSHDATGYHVADADCYRRAEGCVQRDRRPCQGCCVCRRADGRINPLRSTGPPPCSDLLP